MFPSDPDFMSSHFSPNSVGTDAQRTRGSPFDHVSPVSSPGLDDNNQGDRHSRASSVASNQPSPSTQQHGTRSPRPTFQASPRLDVLNSFGNMSVHTPSWGTQPLPNSHSSQIGTETLPQQQKPQSPPRLTMPAGMAFASEATAVPKINAPDSKDDMMFNIVPATPVVGGDAGVRQHAPFQQTLSTLTQGVQLATSEGDIGSQQYQQPQQQHPSPFASPHVVPNELSADYLFPDSSGIRNPQDSSFIDNSHHQLGRSEGTFGLQQQPRVTQHIDEQHRQQHRQQLQSFTFGGNSGGDSLRRTVSDSLAAPRIHRQSRSEEIRPIPAFANPAAANFHGQSNSISGTGPQFFFPSSSHTDFIQRQQQGQFLHPNDFPSSTSTPGLQTQGGRSLSPGMGHMRRASSGSRSGRGAEVWGTQADQLVPSSLNVRRMSPYPTPNASPRINYSDLEDLNDLGLNHVGTTGGNNLSLGGGLGLGLGVGVSAVGVDGIPGIGEPPVSAGYSEEVAITGRNTYARDDVSSQVERHRAESVSSLTALDAGIAQGPIAKQNVTTGRTANASIKRRKQEATFACPVPGCGSTFTRGFNLKGHMRSHYEQKPYKCHWPGCDKGFARQHDCKRHEQLHSNYRPFVCDGCGKNFARMDALNRHLRSEAGAECAKVTEEKSQVQVDEMEDEKKPFMESPPPTAAPEPRRKSTVGSGIGNPGGGGMLGLPDELWASVAV